MDPLAHLTGSPVGVGQVVEPGQRVGQEANIGTAETEASALWPPFTDPDARRPGRALLHLVLVWSAIGKSNNMIEALFPLQ